eukprot:INCI7512.1.p1 GENE.INCI7512.1~~INCI7512.1.p1  ORF type:complete len:433 (+),score=64.15 INCI7512.1:239-1537(+)
MDKGKHHDARPSFFFSRVPWHLVRWASVLDFLYCLGVEAACPDPDPCIYPASINGDEVCDDITNTCACGWDGGDCCSSSSDRSYCTQCECLYTTTPTPTTTPNRTTPGECVDGMSLLSPDNIVVWADVWGYSCEDYFFNDWCIEYGPRNADSAGRTAAEACCSCGGGNMNNEWMFTTETPCTGSMPNWTVRVPLDLYSLNPSTATTQSADSNATAPTHANLTCPDFNNGLCYWRAMNSIEGTDGLTANDACCECGATYAAPTLPPEPICFGGLGTWALHEFIDEAGFPILSVSDCDAIFGAATTVIALLLIVGISCVGSKIITEHKKRAKIAALRLPPKSQLEIEMERRKLEEAERKAKEAEETAQRKALEETFNAETEARRLAAHAAAKNKFASRQVPNSDMGACLLLFRGLPTVRPGRRHQNCCLLGEAK